MINQIKYFSYVFFIMQLFFSCLSSRKNDSYAKDYINLNKNDYAKKYLSLYNNRNIDFSKIKENKAYLTFQNNDTFQVVLFCSDRYTYISSLMPLKMLDGKIPRQKLFRDNYFLIDNNIVKLESVAVNILSVIEEGFIGNDTIFMKKKYYSKNPKKIRTINDKYVLCEKIKVYKFNDDFFVIESD